MKLSHVFFEHVAVTERLLADVAHERLDPGVLCKMSLQVVRRRKPPPTIGALIGVLPLVHRGDVSLEHTHCHELFPTLVTLMSCTSGANCHGNCRLAYTTLSPRVR